MHEVLTPNITDNFLYCNYFRTILLAFKGCQYVGLPFAGRGALGPHIMLAYTTAVMNPEMWFAPKNLSYLLQRRLR